MVLFPTHGTLYFVPRRHPELGQEHLQSLLGGLDCRHCGNCGPCLHSCSLWSSGHTQHLRETWSVASNRWNRYNGIFTAFILYLYLDMYCQFIYWFYCKCRTRYEFLMLMLTVCTPPAVLARSITLVGPRPACSTSCTVQSPVLYCTVQTVWRMHEECMTTQHKSYINLWDKSRYLLSKNI